MDYIMGHKTILNKVLQIKYIQSIFCSHNGFKLEIKNRRITERNISTPGKLSNTLLNNPWVKEAASCKRYQKLD